MFFSDRTIVINLSENKTLLFNTLSGAVDIVDRDTAYLISRSKFNDLPTELINKLIDRGYLYNSKKDQEAISTSLCRFLEGVDKSTMPNFIVIPSYRCNLRCSYCYEGGLTKDFRTMSYRMIQRVNESIDLIIEKKKTSGKAIEVTLMGSEPLLEENKDILNFFLESYQSKGFIVDIITNGTALSYYRDFLFQYGVKEIQVTIDGIGEVHDKRRPFITGEGTFNKIIKGVEDILEKGILVHLRVNVDSQNIDQLPQLADFLVERGWALSNLVKPYIYPLSDAGCLGRKYILEEELVIDKVIKLSQTYENMQLFRWKFHGIDHLESVIRGEVFSPFLRYCSATKSQYVFGPDGKIYTCWWGVGNERYAVGEYYPKLSWHSKRLKEWRSRSIQTISECRKCKYALICGGGCGSKALQQHGTIKSPRCIAFEKILNECAPYFWKLYSKGENNEN